MNKTRIRFVIAFYGDHHRGMLVPLLFSIKRSNPEASITVLGEDIDPKIMRIIKVGYPDVEWIETSYKFLDDIKKRISSKTVMWAQAARQTGGDQVVFLDVDTLVIRDVSAFFSPGGPDVTFTIDDENIYPINTGVVIGSMSKQGQDFFQQWDKESQRIINDPELFRQANSRNYPYGGADQMAFYRLVGFRRGMDSYWRGGLKIQAVPRRILNETRSVSIESTTHIIHYKGGWNKILLRGGNFTWRRPKNSSWQMYIFYLSTCDEAIRDLNRRCGLGLTMNDLGIYIPFYIERAGFREKPVLYPSYYLWSGAKEICRKLRRVILRTDTEA